MTDNDNNVIGPGDEFQYPMVYHVNSKAVSAQKGTHIDALLVDLVRTYNAGIPCSPIGRPDQYEERTGCQREFQVQDTKLDYPRAHSRLVASGKETTHSPRLISLQELCDAHDRGTTIQSNLRTPAGRPKKLLEPGRSKYGASSN